MEKNAYQVGYAVARELRRVSQNEQERNAVDRLTEFNATADDVRLAIDLSRRAGNIEQARLLADMLTPEGP